MHAHVLLPVCLVALRSRHSPVTQGSFDGRCELDVTHVPHLLVALPRRQVDAPVALTLQEVLKNARVVGQHLTRRQEVYTAEQ